MIMIFFLISGIICLSNDKKYERKKDKGLRLEDPIEKKNSLNKDDFQGNSGNDITNSRARKGKEFIPLKNKTSKSLYPSVNILFLIA